MREIINKLNELDELQEGYFHVESTPNFNNHLIGKDCKGNIILLLKCIEEESTINPVSSQGEYLNILYQKECKIKNKLEEKIDTFTILQLKSDNKILINTFINICEHILQELGQYPNIDNTVVILQSIKKLFSNLINRSKKTELGLWGELFLIYISKDYEYLIDSWHKNKNDTFDFNDGSYKIEVKTTTLSERKHNFSLQQLSNNMSDNVVVCSIMTSEIDLGCSIIELVKKISERISIKHKLKLDEKILEIGGNEINTFKNKFDLSTAVNSFKFYNSTNIPNIKKEAISNDLSNIKFTASLENIDSINNITVREGLLSRIQ